jgi:hypothetical protein
MKSLMALLLLAAPAAPPDSPPPRTLVPAGAIAQDRIARLLVDYGITSREDDGPSRTDRFVEAVDGDRYFSDNIHFTRPGAEPWHDPERRQTWAGPGGTTILNLFERTATTTGPGPVEASLLSPYLNCIGWRPRGSAARPSIYGHEFFLRDVLDVDRKGRAVVLPESDVVDGNPSIVVVVDDGRDRIWLCPKLGYALIRRSLKRSDAKAADIEYRCSDFLEITPGLWLPRKCAGEFRWIEGEHRVRSFEIGVTHLAVDEGVSPDLFLPALPPGTIVLDEDRKVISSVPGGADLLDLWAAVAVTFFPPSSTPGPTHREDYTLAFLGLALAGWGFWLAGPPMARRAGRVDHSGSEGPLIPPGPADEPRTASALAGGDLPQGR